MRQRIRRSGGQSPGGLALDVMMEGKMRTFVELLDKALEIAETRLSEKKAGKDDPASQQGLENIVFGLRRTRERALSGRLGPSEGQARLGLSYTVLDWGEPIDSPLLEVADQIERFYKENL